MCGRFSLTEDIHSLQQFFQFEFAGDVQPRYNIAPGQMILTVVADKNKRIGKYMKWGFIPYWSKDEKIAYKLINARGETIDTKNTFKNAFKKRRCLILADGYYEWKQTEHWKKPMRFIRQDRKPFAFAGLWEVWTKDQTPITTCTIITTKPNMLAGEVHDRMPVILPENAYDFWLDPKNNQTTDLKELLKPYPAEFMEKYEVSPSVNSPKNDDPELIKPIQK